MLASLDAAPLCPEVTARTLNVYSVPLVKPVTSCSVVEAVLPEIGDQSPYVPLPSFCWYS